MPLPNTMADLSTTASNNSPTGGENPNSTDDFHRTIQAIVRSTNAKGNDIASAATINLGGSTGEFVDVTGTTTITSLGTVSAGIVRTVRFTGALTLTHNAATLILPSASNITTSTNDVATFRSLGSGNWLCVSYTKADGNPITVDASITSDIADLQTNKLDIANKATQADAIAGTNNAKYMTALRVQQAIDNIPTVVRSWQDVTSSRALGTDYVNNEGHEIQINVVTSSSSAHTTVATVAGELLTGSSFSSGGANATITVNIPDGATYSVTDTGPFAALSLWKELK